MSKYFRGIPINTPKIPKHFRLVKTVAIKNYPPGNEHIPPTGTFEDDFPLPKVGYVCSLECNCSGGVSGFAIMYPALWSLKHHLEGLKMMIIYLLLVMLKKSLHITSCLLHLAAFLHLAGNCEQEPCSINTDWCALCWAFVPGNQSELKQNEPWKSLDTVREND